MSNKRLDHPFDAIVDENSKVLILGSFPSIKSFEDNSKEEELRVSFSVYKTSEDGTTSLEEAGNLDNRNTPILQTSGGSTGIFVVVAQAVSGGDDVFQAAARTQEEAQGLIKKIVKKYQEDYLGEGYDDQVEEYRDRLRVEEVELDVIPQCWDPVDDPR